MDQLVTDAILQVAAAILSVVVSAIVGYVGVAAKRLVDSKKTREYASALRHFDEDLYASLTDLGAAVEQTLREKGTEFTENDRYEQIQQAILKKANDYARKTGVRTDFSGEELDALVRGAIREGKAAWQRSYGD